MVRPPATPENARARELRASSSRAVLATLSRICGAERREVLMTASFVAIGRVRCISRGAGKEVHTCARAEALGRDGSLLNGTVMRWRAGRVAGGKLQFGSCMQQLHELGPGEDSLERA